MNILVLNCGSSSIKYKLFDMTNNKIMAQGGIEKIGLPDSFLLAKLPDGTKKQINHPIPEHTVGIELILNTLTNKEYGCIENLHQINAVGHRVVHGGEKFNKSVLITPEVKAMIVQCSDLAPLHNPANLKGINAIEKSLPNVPQVAVFDTAFHQTMPDYAFMYALPYEYYEKYAVRRYGFHGTSHRYVSQRVGQFLNTSTDNKKIITVHIGNGGSCTAIGNGKSVDTSMGLTPLEGLVMGTRSGDIDFGVASFLMEKENLSAKQMSDICNKKSGLLGVSGISSDARDIDDAIKKGNKRADLARKMFIYRVKKYIGAYTAVMNGLDILVFTGGIGENDTYIRTQIALNMDYLGIQIDETRSLNSRGKEEIISTADSKVTVCVIPTDEESMIASDTLDLVSIQ